MGDVRGHSAAASGSIPTKYATYVLNNSEDKKGFTSKSKRFQNAINDLPGPGAYLIKENENCASYSKKGTGGFASRSSRYSRFPTKSSPHPTSYDLRRELTDRHDFNRSFSSSFQKPIALAKKYSVTRQPAPNQYNTSRAFSKTTGKPHACGAAFKSKTKRSLDQLIKSCGSNLSPAQYQLNEPHSGDEPKVTSCFRSRTERLLHDTKNTVPGPGTYDHKAELSEMTKGDGQQQFQPPHRKHFLTISAPAMPMPPLPPTPGPGSYELVDFGMYKLKKVKSSAVFQSGSSRWLQQNTSAAPGPGFYNPKSQEKQSYLFNTNKKWQPA